ncbi:MAG TPA: adenylate/guanylate cyclase domain-containing protein [Rhodocyclaceae bacterium]
MKPTSSAPASDGVPPDAAGIAPVHLFALDHGPWQEVQRNLRHALESRSRERLLAPVTAILNHLLDGALQAMHLRVFRRIMETEFGLAAESNEAQAQVLYANELSEHGSQNIVHACAAIGWRISVSFPPAAADGCGPLVRIEVPFAWEADTSRNRQLLDALGLRVGIEASASGTTIQLLPDAERCGPFAAPRLLSAEARLDSVERILDELGYGLVHFSPAGEVAAASPAMLERLAIDPEGDWAHQLQQAIPLSFHNEIVWGQALAGGSGRFENFRIRVTPPAPEESSILFNVSGFRQPDGTVLSLWQVVSQEAGHGALSEGSILSGMRVHNITRHYVPQLVEQKAREAVHAGKETITNEDRQVAVLFCDIVGFTSYVECNADNESIVETLNFVLARVSHSVTRHRGAIDKFMGDSIMAIFDDPADAILAGLDMQAHSEDLNLLRSRAGQQTLQLRIGIHWGEVAICNVGIPERLDWTAIGDVVNTAARIQKGCQPGFVLVSAATRDVVAAAHPDKFHFGDIFGLQAKGKRDELPVCNVRLAAP